MPENQQHHDFVNHINKLKNMCGIAGIFDTRGQRPIDQVLLNRMNELQEHRGPDEGGVHIEPGVGLAHRRLSIIDLSSGRQPMFNEDGSVAVVFNGEIYNFQGLAKELRSIGHVFRTSCDTEVIVHAWEEWGEECVARFRGMFAFAVWDRNQRALFLARDRLGIKPVYYSLLPDGYFVFASELKALTVHSSFSKQIDISAVEDYFAYGYIPDPKTIFANTKKLAPGHVLMVRPNRMEVEPREYWDVSFASQTITDVEEIKEQLIDRLREAVRIRMISDVPLGAFLSGGVDSSAIVSLMSEIANQPVSACTITFGEKEYNEEEYASEVAEQYKILHHIERVSSDDFDLVHELASLYDEPYADSSALPTYRVCQLARKHVTVVLSGDGGDENFAGYRRYRWHAYEERIRSLMQSDIRTALFGFLGDVYPKMDWAPKWLRAKTTFQSLARDSLEGYLHSVSVVPHEIRRHLYNASLKRQLQGYDAIEVLMKHSQRAPTAHPVSIVQYLDFKTYLPGDILTKVDRASMAHGLEVRVPILDHEFVDWVSGLPAAMKLKGREGKHIFKEALRSRLSDNILFRPKKGFAVPLSEWFRGRLQSEIREAIFQGGVRESGFFNMGFVEQLLHQHQSRQREHSAVLWSILMFGAFYNNLTR